MILATIHEEQASTSRPIQMRQTAVPPAPVSDSESDAASTELSDEADNSLLSDTSESSSTTEKRRRRRRGRRRRISNSNSSSSGALLSSTDDSSSGLDDILSISSSNTESESGAGESSTSEELSETDSTSLESTDEESDGDTAASEENHHLSNVAPWTESQDALLIGMKNDNATWKAIAAVLQHNEKDCQARWDLLTARNKGASTSPDSDEQTNEDGGGKPSKCGESETKQLGGKSPQSRPVNGTRAPDPTEETGLLVADNPATPGHNDARNDDWDNDNEWHRQREYLYGTLYPQLYPPTCKLQPDDKLDAEDSYILSRIIDRMRRSRILQLQADFFNATGHMVPLEVLEDKYRVAVGESERELADVT